MKKIVLILFFLTTNLITAKSQTKIIIRKGLEQIILKKGTQLGLTTDKDSLGYFEGWTIDSISENSIVLVNQESYTFKTVSGRDIDKYTKTGWIIEKIIKQDSTNELWTYKIKHIKDQQNKEFNYKDINTIHIIKKASHSNPGFTVIFPPALIIVGIVNKLPVVTALGVIGTYAVFKFIRNNKLRYYKLSECQIKVKQHKTS